MSDRILTQNKITSIPVSTTRYSLASFVLPILALLLAGCSGQMVSLYETEYSHPVEYDLSKERIREAIFEGSKTAGWVAEDENSSRILATYQIRIHTVNVSIYYSETYYRTLFRSSIAMKMYCSEREKQNNRHIVSGIRYCPGDRPPTYINANYKLWIDELVAAIDAALATKQ